MESAPTATIKNLIQINKNKPKVNEKAKFEIKKKI